MILSGVTESGYRAQARRVARIVEQAACVTPLLESRQLNERVGGRVLLKAESLQETGSFKYRGAWYALTRLDPAQRKAGIVGISSGNHAQGLACAAKQLGIRATIVMPVTAPDIKVARTKAHGADVVLFDGPRDEWDTFARTHADVRGAHYVHSYDDPNIILGQSTVGLEIIAQAKAARVRVDIVLSPCGGGGLTAGCCLAFEAFSPNTEIVSVEPHALNDMQRSICVGAREENPVAARSICDALGARRPGKLAFEIIARVVRRGISVGDDMTLRTVGWAARQLKLVVEPGGAVALAAVLAGAIDLRGRCAVVILSGGNISPTLLGEAIAAAEIDPITRPVAQVSARS